MSLWISWRMVLASEVSKQSLDQVVIYIRQMLRKRELAKGMDLIIGLRENYTQVEISLPT